MRTGNAFMDAVGEGGFVVKQASSWNIIDCHPVTTSPAGTTTAGGKGLSVQVINQREGWVIRHSCVVCGEYTSVCFQWKLMVREWSVLFQKLKPHVS